MDSRLWGMVDNHLISTGVFNPPNNGQFRSLCEKTRYIEYPAECFTNSISPDRQEGILGTLVPGPPKVLENSNNFFGEVMSLNMSFFFYCLARNGEHIAGGISDQRLSG